MGVVACEPKYMPSEGQDSIDERSEFRSYSITYVVQCNSPTDSSATVLRATELPGRDSVYSYGGFTDKDATLKRRDVRHSCYFSPVV